MLENELLDKNAWMLGLTPEQRDRVRRDIVIKLVKQGEYVCRKGEDPAYWHGVISGLLKITNVSMSGKEVTFLGVPPGGWFGEGSMLKDQPRPYDVVALRDSQVAYLPRTTFTWLLDNSISFNRFLVNQLNERLGQFIAAIEYERLLDTDAKVAKTLAWMFNPYLYPGQSSILAISQEEVGHLCGLSRQRANMALKALEQVNLIRVSYGEIEILDLPGLKNFGL